jgi:hypothetical protein
VLLSFRKDGILCSAIVPETALCLMPTPEPNSRCSQFTKLITRKGTESSVYLPRNRDVLRNQLQAARPVSGPQSCGSCQLVTNTPKMTSQLPPGQRAVFSGNCMSTAQQQLVCTLYCGTEILVGLTPTGVQRPETRSLARLISRPDRGCQPTGGCGPPSRCA